MKKIILLAVCVAVAVMMAVPSFAIEPDEAVIKKFYKKSTAYSPATLHAILTSCGLEFAENADVPSSYKITSTQSSAYSPRDMHRIFTAYGLQLDDASKLPAIYGKEPFSNTSTAYCGETLKQILSAYVLPAPPMATGEPDSDGDGVPDSMDRCPNTPRGVAVDKYGCPIKKATPPADTDKDGVPDESDACPGTPRGANIDDRGCWVLNQDYLFDFDKAVVKPQYYPILDDVVKILNDNPSLSLILEGHTDSIGAAAYNQNLSERRANAVKKYLIKNGMIDAARLSIMGYGETRPIASNDTKEGRSKNRRVELTPQW